MSDMTEVAPNVYVGGWSAARDRASQFDMIVNCAVDAPNFGAAHFPLVDGPGNDPATMRAAIAFVEDAIRNDLRTLVHCVSGKSRSVTVAAAALSRFRGTTLAAEIAVVASHRGCDPAKNQPHPALVDLAR